MIQKYGLYIIWVLSCLGTLGSLYLGQPSYLDWYQRICLFPLVFIAGVAAWRGFSAIASYFIPQALIGLACALYQILLLKMPETLAPLYFESVSYPLLSYAFAAIFACILVLSVWIPKQAIRG